jgi:hypothetical protein
VVFLKLADLVLLFVEFCGCDLVVYELDELGNSTQVLVLELCGIEIVGFFFVFKIFILKIKKINYGYRFLMIIVMIINCKGILLEIIGYKGEPDHQLAIPTDHLGKLLNFYDVQGFIGRLVELEPLGDRDGAVPRLQIAERLICDWDFQ